MNYNNQNYSQDLIFSLDIGTRTVIGVVGYQQNDKFIVVAIEKREHQSRAMIDGQIHDVSKVAEVVKSVKEDLERKIGVSLKQVGIAAAGRVLCTVETHAEQFFEEDTIIDVSHIQALELQGMRTAYDGLQIQLNSTHPDYFCVGYSVIRYYLNNYRMSNLEGHKGRHIAIDMIGTFLPQIVIDSLYAVVQRAGLEVMNLTLEPIAAIEVVIPKEIQLLNLALVDIGAGTSDIAITKEGSISAYGMIPVAGDEITEQILHHCLTDFNTAEQIKLQISQKDEITFQDIFGLSQTISKETLLEILEPAVDKIALDISQKILTLNGGKSPNAVFCVGGGSQMIGFVEKLAAYLELPIGRVAIRGLEVAAKRIGFPSKLSGPEMITPLGLCLVSISQRGNSFVDIIFNKEPLRLFNTHSLVVMDVATYKGFDHTNLISRKGKDLVFILNGESKKIKGEIGQPAQISLNGQSVSLQHPIQAGDNLEINPASHGKDAVLSVQDLLASLDEQREIIIKINGQDVSEQTLIQTDDEVLFVLPETKDELFNGEAQDISKKEHVFYLIVNGQPLHLPKKQTGYIFVDIFNYIDFDLNQPQGRIVLLLNGQQAAFVDPIHSGDEIQIYWQ
ncbi:MAG: cell division protein FtsA [Epulopiscium sp.]|nr:cell division protein FtsA [Candidatus Epulonipiscium sp.]